MELELVLDIGSTHRASVDNIKRHVDKAAGLPINLKAQLFPTEMTGPNVYLPFDMYAEAWEYARSCKVQLYASVFSVELARRLSELDRSRCKLAFSQRHLINEPYDHTDGPAVRSLFDEWVVSYPLTEATIGEASNVRQLLCIPEYPVYYPLCADEIDWTNWGGFSDHTLGIEQTIYIVKCAEDQGLRNFQIEKHIRLDATDSCPDATFAISWEQVKEFVRRTTQRVVS